MEYQLAMEKKVPAGNGDHFIVEDLLDFSNDDVAAAEEELSPAGDVAALNCSADSNDDVAGDSCNSSFSDVPAGRSLNGAGFSGELCEPQYDELAELEWLSNFVEESFSTEDLQKLQLLSGFKPTITSPPLKPLSTSPSSSSATDHTKSHIISATPFPSLSHSPSYSTDHTKAHTVSAIPDPALFTIPSPCTSTDHTKGHTVSATADPTPFRPLPAKARSKRSRSSAPWSSHLLPPNPNPSSSPNPNPNPKKARFSPPSSTDLRRCVHCQTDKTPQWRTGPMGPKTLCNACGVRYKSGRLVPEYRPAASPTFVVAQHSNSHRKVLELRRQKEAVVSNQHVMVQQGFNGGNGEEFLIHRRIGPDFRQLI